MRSTRDCGHGEGRTGATTAASHPPSKKIDVAQNDRHDINVESLLAFEYVFDLSGRTREQGT